MSFEEGDGIVQVQIELFQNGDVLICYGEGDIPEGNEFRAGIKQDYTSGDSGVTYPIEDPLFDEDGYTRDWPECKCWKFKMP